MAAKKAKGARKVFITPKDVESIGLGSARKVMELCQEGTVKALKFGTTWRVYRDEFCAQFDLDPRVFDFVDGE